MILINNEDEDYFRLNGIKYTKNFIIIKQGLENISVHNIYDTKQNILSSTHFSQISVGGNIYNNQIDLIDNLTSILFTKKIHIPSTTVSTSTPSGIPANGDEWITYSAI
ncbi:hypothetical protein [Flavobacterium muglaense]|uniref:Uncharacterized protein n=1 Tax=Flavobacterium muglaense TaxID=2764716 RepID=A0A923MWX5_9FLAO|nr:hypothetical protein [Flavobacterium muglaense]MBC5836789.1 hypothetical protein [Flavobacterium muglaense]MBC5843261.1 hypothetical protein [Flavobacterium muglaense]